MGPRARVRIQAGGSLLAGALAACNYLYEGTVPPPGSLERFDPIDAYPQVAAFAGTNAQLAELSAAYVEPSGTVNLGADTEPTVNYRFVAPASPEDVEARRAVLDNTAAPAVKDGGVEPSEQDVATEPPATPNVGFSAGELVTIEVTIHAPRLMSKTPDGIFPSYKHRGMERRVTGKANGPPIVPAPVCPLRELWRGAQIAGVSASAVATVEYHRTAGRTPAVPTYDLRPAGTNRVLNFDATCKLMDE